MIKFIKDSPWLTWIWKGNKIIGHISKEGRHRGYYFKLYGKQTIRNCTTRTLKKAKEIISNEFG